MSYATALRPLFFILRCTTVTLLLISGAFAAEPVIADPVRFDIDEQPLGSALNEFARQSDREILFSTNVVRDKDAHTVAGVYEPEDALHLLLADTGLEYALTSSDTFLVSEEDPEPGKSKPASSQVLMAQSQTSAQQTPRISEDEDESEPVDEYIETIVVTGSHIPRPISDPSAGLIVIDKSEIAAGGYATVDDYLATLSQNYGSVGRTTSRATPGGNASNASAIDLRGLGADSTLTLLNGRRMAPSGGQAAQLTDISVIPTSAIERIEVLTDGASAVFGSDAVGGVVNIILRKDYEGSETSVRVANDDDGDSAEYLVSQLLGLGWDTGNVIFNYEFLSRDELLRTERPFSASSDLTAFGGRDFRISFFAQPANVLALGPEFSSIPGVPFAAVPTGQDGTALTPADLIPFTSNFTDTANFVSISPDERRHSFFTGLQQELGSMDFSFTGVYSDRETKMPSLPPLFVGVVPSAGVNPFNPLPEPVLVAYLFERELGAPEFAQKQTAINLSASLQGEMFSGSRFEPWQWEVAGQYGRDENEGPRLPSLDPIAADMALADPNPATALNLFGDGSAQNQATLDGIFGFSDSVGTGEVTGGSAKINGSIFEAPGGPAKLAVGVEYREESFDSTTFQPGLPPMALAGDRSVNAAFFEVLFPMWGDPNAGTDGRRLDLSIAGRYEDYDDFGDAVSPKVSLLWVPHKNLMLRGSWGSSFRAPQLFELFLPSQSIFQPIFDAARGEVVPIDFRIGGNPNLVEEEADTWNVGFNYTPEFAPGLALQASYFDIAFTDRIISGLDPQTILSLEAVLPPGVVERAPPTPADIAAGLPGQLISLNGAFINAAVTNISGFDIGATYSIETDVGQFNAGVMGTYYADYENQFTAAAPVLEQKATIGFPQEFRGKGTFGWSRNEWSVNAIVNYTGSYENTSSPIQNKIDDFTTLDVNAMFRSSRDNGLFRGVVASFGITNLFDTDPPFADVDAGYDALSGNPRGRVIYLQLSKNIEFNR